MQRHTHQEFIRFLNAVERAVPAGKLVHAVLDNYGTHKHPKVKAWLARHPRWTFHFTPKSGSWLNAVEGFFSKLTRQRIRRGVFRSIVDLQADHQPLPGRAQPQPQTLRMDQARRRDPRQTQSTACTFRLSQCTREIPAKAGTHFSVVSGAAEWVPAFAGTYDYSEAADMTRWHMRAMFAAGPTRPV